MSQREAWRLGGPSMPTWTEIERGEGPELQGRTLAKLDLVLGWKAGSARRVLAGGDPVLDSVDDEGVFPEKMPPPPDGLTPGQLARWHRDRILIEGRNDLGKQLRRHTRMIRGAYGALDMAFVAHELGARAEDIEKLVSGIVGTLASSGVMGVMQDNDPQALAEYFGKIADIRSAVRENAGLDPTQHAGVSGTAPMPTPSQSDLDLAANEKRPGSTPVQEARREQDEFYPDEEGPEGGA